MTNCKVIIFDEPTAVLTQSEAEILFRIVATLKQRGLGILYISHHLAGRELKDIYPPKAAVPLAGAVPSTELRAPSSVHVSPEVLREFEGVSFQLRLGEILGFAGRVGSGRTEVARTITGLYRKPSGEVFLRGKKLDIRSYRDSIRRDRASTRRRSSRRPASAPTRKKEFHAMSEQSTQGSETRTADATRGIRGGLGRFQGFREGSTILIIVAIGVVMSILSPIFLTAMNLRTMFMPQDLLRRLQ